MEIRDENPVEIFLGHAIRAVSNAYDRPRMEFILGRWTRQWEGDPRRRLEVTVCQKLCCLHFMQLIGVTWSQAFSFHAHARDGFFLKGPDTDRIRKSHRHRDHPLDRRGLDALFEAWSQHPEALPAGQAVEFRLEATPDEVWEACLQEALLHLRLA